VKAEPNENRKFEPDLDQWDAPEELLELIADKKLRQRDRVELVIAFYAADHGGVSPTYEEIGKIMGISAGNAFNYAMELTRPWECRAVKRNGKFWLVNSQYSHPVIREKRFSEVKQPL